VTQEESLSISYAVKGSERLDSLEVRAIISMRPSFANYSKQIATAQYMNRTMNYYFGDAMNIIIQSPNPLKVYTSVVLSIKFLTLSIRQ
jgi:hypothetical protein